MQANAFANAPFGMGRALAECGFGGLDVGLTASTDRTLGAVDSIEKVHAIGLDTRASNLASTVAGDRRNSAEPAGSRRDHHAQSSWQPEHPLPELPHIYRLEADP